MKPEKRCPYCGCEALVCESNRIDQNNNKLVVSDTMYCYYCEEKIIIQTEYAPVLRSYYSGDGDGELIKKEVSSYE